MKRMVLSSLCLLALVCAGNATDIYNNLGSSTDGSDSVLMFGPAADSFSTGTGNFQLNMVGVLLNGDPTTGGGVSIDLLSDVPGPPPNPGSSLLHLGTVSDSSLSSAFAVFSFSAAYPLASNTRYWIQVSDTGFSTSANWAWSGDQTALGVAGEFFSNFNGVFDNSFSPYQMEVDVIPVSSAVPEPGTLLLLGSGCLGVIGAVRRKLQM